MEVHTPSSPAPGGAHTPRKKEPTIAGSFKCRSWLCCDDVEA